MAGPDVRVTHHSHSQRAGCGALAPAQAGLLQSADPKRGPIPRWLLWQQLPLLSAQFAASVIEWLPGSVGPYLVGKIVDEGIIPGDLAVVGGSADHVRSGGHAGIVASVLGHTLVVRTWLVAMYGSMKLVTRKATQMGHVLPQRSPTGEVLSVVGE